MNPLHVKDLHFGIVSGGTSDLRMETTRLYLSGCPSRPGPLKHRPKLNGKAIDYGMSLLPSQVNCSGNSGFASRMCLLINDLRPDELRFLCAFSTDLCFYSFNSIEAIAGFATGAVRFLDRTLELCIRQLRVFESILNWNLRCM